MRLPHVGRGGWVGFEPGCHFPKFCLPCALKAGGGGERGEEREKEREGGGEREWGGAQGECFSFAASC